MLLSSFAINTT